MFKQKLVYDTEAKTDRFISASIFELDIEDVVVNELELYREESEEAINDPKWDAPYANYIGGVQRRTYWRKEPPHHLLVTTENGTEYQAVIELSPSRCGINVERQDPGSEEVIECGKHYDGDAQRAFRWFLTELSKALAARADRIISINNITEDRVLSNEEQAEILRELNIEALVT